MAQMNNYGSGPQIGQNTGPVNITVLPPTKEALEFIVQTFGRQYAQQFLQQCSVVQALPPSLSETLSESPPPPVPHEDIWEALSHDCYNLFVLENEEYDDGTFSLSKDRALTKYTSADFREQYRFLDEEAVRSLVNMPCIFAKRNCTYYRTVPEHPALLGRIKEICNQGSTIKIVFEGYHVVPQQLLNNHTADLGLARAALRNELDEEHWSIKEGNLQQIISSLGITVL